MSLSFMLSADAVGVFDAETFVVRPDILVAQLMDAAKRHARFLEAEFPRIGHRNMLEIVAKAAGFPNWHAFQTLLDKVAVEYAPPAGGNGETAPSELFEPFVSALPLLVSVGSDIAPTTQELAGLTGLVVRLSRHLGDQRKIETVIAKLNSADTWHDLLARKPEESPEPLYEFHVHEDGYSRFDWSDACATLVEELDDLWQHYEERSKPDQAKARRYVASVLKKRPDFLEGWLAQGTMEMLEGRDENAGPAFKEGVDRALALIPKGFKGEISWLHLDNRPYHRLLYNYMHWHVRRGNTAAAIKLARTQLRQNPNDNLGVRFDLPLFLAIAEEGDAALKAMARIQKDGERDDGHLLLILAICSLLLGDIKGGQVYFLRAFFDLPALRPLLLTDQLPDDFVQGRRLHHGVIPDFDMLWFHYEAARFWRKDIDFDSMFKAMLQDAEVISAECETHARYQKSVDGWADFASKTAEVLVERNGKAWCTKMR